MDRRFRALFLADGEQPGEPSRHAPQPAVVLEVVVQQSRPDHAGVQAIGRHRAALQAARQLPGEQDVGQLRIGVGEAARVAALELQVVDSQPGPAVDGEGGLDPVDGLLALVHEHAGVVDEPVDGRERGANLPGQGADRIQRRQIRDERGLRPGLGAGAFAARPIAADDPDPVSLPRQRRRSGFSDATIGSGD